MSKYRSFDVARVFSAITFGCALLAAPGAAFAYVGPGAGLTFIASLVAVVVAGVIMLAGLVVFPIRLMMKAARRKKADQASVDPTP